MARRIAAEHIGWPTYEDAAAHNHHTDEYASVALAAIIETTELAASFAETIDPLDGPAIAALFRAGKHYRKDEG